MANAPLLPLPMLPAWKSKKHPQRITENARFRFMGIVRDALCTTKAAPLSGLQRPQLTNNFYEMRYL
jgi:hypothetical protein